MRGARSELAGLPRCGTMPRALLALSLALSCAASVGAGGGWDERGYDHPADDHPALEFARSFLGRSESLRALRTVDASATTSLAKGSMVTSCDELGGIGNLSSTESPCVVPENASVSLSPGTWILGSGSLTLSPASSMGCDAPGCLITVLLGGTLRVNHRARVHGGYVNVTAAAVEIIGAGASVDADGLADPNERRGWNRPDESDGDPGGWNRPDEDDGDRDPNAGAGFGGEGASCPPPGRALPTGRGGPGYAYASCVVDAIAAGAPPLTSGTSAGNTAGGGAGGGRVVLVTRSLRFGGGGVVSSRGASPPAVSSPPSDEPTDDASLGGGSGGSVVVYAEVIVEDHPPESIAGGDDGGGGGDAAGVAGRVLATGGDGASAGETNGGGGGGGRIALLAPDVWPPSVPVVAGGGRSGGACGDAGFNGAAGTVVNFPAGSLTVSNAQIAGAGSVPQACLEPSAWGACATTRLNGRLPTQGFDSLLIKSGALACTDACPSSLGWRGGREGDDQVFPDFLRDFWGVADFGGGRRRALLGGSDDPPPTPGAGGVVHVEVSSAVTLTGAAHLLHGDPVAPLGEKIYSEFRSASSVTLWLVAPAVAVTDRSTLQVVGRLSVDGGPTGGGSLAVKGSSRLTVAPKPADASSYIFNVDTVEVSDGSVLEVTGGGALSVLGRVADRGSVTVGDADVGLDDRYGRSGGGISVLAAGQLVVDRFALVLVNKRGVIKAPADSGGDGDEKCSSLSCPAYVYGPGAADVGRSSNSSDGASSGAIPCQSGNGSPFSLQLCHCVDVVVGEGGIIAAKAMHMYSIETVTVSNAAAISADRTGCRAGEGQGKGVSFLGGAGGGGGYGGSGGGGFTPPSTNSTGAGTIATGGGAYGSSDAPCAAAAVGSGGGDGAGAGFGGSGGGVVVLGTRLKPLGKLVVLDGGEVSANGGTGGDTAPSNGGTGGETAPSLLKAPTGVPASVPETAVVRGGGGGGGSGGTVVVFTRALSVDPGGRIAADGGGGGWSGGGGGGGGRVHLHWPLPLPPITGGDEDGAGGVNRSAPLGAFSAVGGAGGADGGINSTGAAGSVTTIACPPGYTGLLCLRCLPGTFKDAKGSQPCALCDPIPPRAVYADTARAAGATSPNCPYKCVGDSLRMPDCVTRWEGAVNAVGGPIAAAAMCAALAVALALPATLVHARVSSIHERWSLGSRGRRMGTRGGLGSRRRFGATGKFRSSPSSRGSGDRLEGYGSGGEDQLAQPFLQSLSEVIDVESSDVTRAFLARVYFTGSNHYADPWRLPATPPAAVRPLLRADEWNQLVRACLLGAPPSWGTPLEGGQGQGQGQGGHGGGGTGPDGSYAGARHSGTEGAFHAFLTFACPPLGSWLLARARRRAAAAVALLVDHYDRRCLRSARARALQEGLTFGCSRDATCAWLDVFVQGDEEEGTVPASLLASAAGVHARSEVDGLESLTARLPMPVVFSGDGSYASPWRWGEEGGEEEEADDPSGEGLPVELLRLAAPDEILGPVLSGVRSRLRACRRVATKRDALAGGGARDDDDAEAGDTRRRANEEGATSFTFALDDRGPSALDRDSRDGSDAVFAACEGLDGLAGYLAERANPALRCHGVALALAAFVPEGVRPKIAARCGQFQMGVVIHALASDDEDKTGEDATAEEEDATAEKDDEDPAEEDEEQSDVDDERGLLLPPPAVDSPQSSLAGSVDEVSLRGAAAWAAAAATVASSPARRKEPERLLSLRELASPASSMKGRRSGGSASVSSKKSNRSAASNDEEGDGARNGVEAAVGTPDTGSKMNWPPMLDASPPAALASARRLSFGTRRAASRRPSRRRRRAADDVDDDDAALRSRLPRSVLIAPTASRLASLTADETGTRTFLARVALALLRNGRERPRGGGERVFVAVFAAIIVALDAVCSFAVVAQSLACDAFASAMVFSAPPLALPLAPMLGAAATFRSLVSKPAAARTLRAYAEWTMASSVAVVVAFFADATDAIGIDVFGGECARGPWSSGGRAWFVVPLAAAAVKAAAVRAASARAADLEARVEEDATARRRERESMAREPTGGHRW